MLGIVLPEPRLDDCGSECRKAAWYGIAAYRCRYFCLWLRREEAGPRPRPVTPDATEAMLERHQAELRRWWT